ncbi:MAG TPA: DUF4404 family protein [Steroidobacteraceae bacterium]|nr:DUF4404 family protein [Steroidobacteraceae bacterium]
MSSIELQQQLSTLTASLAQLNTADSATRPLLTNLQTEVGRLLSESEPSVTDRLEAMAIRFENDHPAAGTALRQAIDALAKAGI